MYRPEVRQIVVDAGGVRLSGLLCEPEGVPARATVVAVHGGGMRAGYFDGRAHPRLSLLTLGATLGFTVLALDRPGYGLSAGRFPDGQDVAGQAAILRAALDGLSAAYPTGAGQFLVAHSYGGKVALTAAADCGDGLVGLDVSGCGHAYAGGLDEPANLSGPARWQLNWGRPGLYPPNTFTGSRDLVTGMPDREWEEARHWPARFPDIAARVGTPVRFTFAEHERWWRHDESAVAELVGMFTRTRVVVDRQADAGHNLSLGWAARSYHLRALGFLEECLAPRESAGRP